MFYLLLVLVALCFNSFAESPDTENLKKGNKWQESMVLDWELNFDFVYYIGQDWIVGFINDDENPIGGEIYLSIDNGNIWSIVEFNITPLVSIKFCPHEENFWRQTKSARRNQSLTGFAIGGSKLKGDHMYIGKTLDGGKTWTDLSRYFRESLGKDTNVPLKGIHVVNADLVFVSSKNNVFMSRDGGLTWSETADINNDAYLNSDLQFIHKRGSKLPPGTLTEYGYISSQKALYFTDNAGESWQKINCPWCNKSSVELKELTFLNHKTGYALLEGKIGHDIKLNVLTRTTDGGESWKRIKSWKDKDFYPVSVFVDNGFEIFVGGTGEYIWYSSNSGKDWKVEYKTQTYNRVEFFQRLGNNSVIAWVSSGDETKLNFRSYLLRE